MRRQTTPCCDDRPYFCVQLSRPLCKKLIDAGELGEVRYVYTQRLKLGRIRSDIDALWNFAPHDISIIQYWLGDPEPISIGPPGYGLHAGRDRRRCFP